LLDPAQLRRLDMPAAIVLAENLVDMFAQYPGYIVVQAPVLRFEELKESLAELEEGANVDPGSDSGFWRCLLDQGINQAGETSIERDEQDSVVSVCFRQSKRTMNCDAGLPRTRYAGCDPSAEFGPNGPMN